MKQALRVTIFPTAENIDNRLTLTVAGARQVVDVVHRSLRMEGLAEQPVDGAVERCIVQRVSGEESFGFEDPIRFPASALEVRDVLKNLDRPYPVEAVSRGSIWKWQGRGAMRAPVLALTAAWGPTESRLPASNRRRSEELATEDDRSSTRTAVAALHA